MELSKNADRFTGFADVYESARPEMPHYAMDVIRLYMEKQPDTVVDLGCGTGLSTACWEGHCNAVIGIEPSEDMLRLAEQKRTAVVPFRKAYAHDTGLPALCADAVVCSQSFHWMEPAVTLQEIDRILKPGGVFAAVDCDWPPVCGLQAETAYTELFRKVEIVESGIPEIRSSFRRWEKTGHLRNIKESGYFRYSREIVFEHTERCDAARFIAIAQSQGSLQTILKIRPDLIREDLDRFLNAAAAAFGEGSRDIQFCYRMRIGVK